MLATMALRSRSRTLHGAINEGTLIEAMRHPVNSVFYPTTPTPHRVFYSTGGRVLLISHGGVISTIYRHAMGHEAPAKVPNASVSIFHVSEDDTWQLVQWAGVQHLSDVGFDAAAFGGGGSTA